MIKWFYISIEITARSPPRKYTFPPRGHSWWQSNTWSIVCRLKMEPPVRIQAVIFKFTGRGGRQRNEIIHRKKSIYIYYTIWYYIYQREKIAITVKQKHWSEGSLDLIGPIWFQTRTFVVSFSFSCLFLSVLERKESKVTKNHCFLLIRRHAGGNSIREEPRGEVPEVTERLATSDRTVPLSRVWRP